MKGLWWAHDHNSSRVQLEMCDLLMEEKIRKRVKDHI